jgi:hypothetical protein
MLELAELQTQFAAALEYPETSGVDAWVRANRISADRRIAVYRNNSRISQTEALAGIYPAVKQLVGENFFEHMADEYKGQYPSTSGDLREYGAALACFLASFEPVARLPYLPDVASLEWAWHECFHAAATEAVNAKALEALSTVTGGDTRLSLIPASRLIASSYPVADIWAFALDPERHQQKLNLDALDEARLLIARLEDHVNVMALTPEQFFWLGCIASGETLAASVEHTLASHPNFDLATSLATFVGLEVLIIA